MSSDEGRGNPQPLDERVPLLAKSLLANDLDLARGIHDNLQRSRHLFFGRLQVGTLRAMERA
eukprot:666995-Pyramimonas_sp.AAC.1